MERVADDVHGPSVDQSHQDATPARALAADRGEVPPADKAGARVFLRRLADGR